jgi:hypothetical protein
MELPRRMAGYHGGGRARPRHGAWNAVVHGYSAAPCRSQAPTRMPLLFAYDNRVYDFRVATGLRCSRPGNRELQVVGDAAV